MILSAEALGRHTVLAAILVTARAVVADPARWCHYHHATDASGRTCEGRADRAAAWGAVGALDRAAADAGAPHVNFLDAQRHLKDASVIAGRKWTGTPWLLSSEAAHAMTVACFDEALDILPKPPAPGPLHALAVARTLIARPERWAQGAIALDRHGRALVTFDGGCRFCAAGALGLASHVLTEQPPDGDLTGSAFDRAERLLDSAAYALAEYQSYIGLNEHDSHAQVIAMFDHALDAASPRPAPQTQES